MRDGMLQPVDRYTTTRAGAPSPSDREYRGWLRRLSRNLVQRKLDSAMLQFVRLEKYSSALIVSMRIAMELEEPLRDLGRQIALLDRYAERDPEIRRLAANLRRDREAILSSVQHLAEIEPPTGPAD